MRNYRKNEVQEMCQAPSPEPLLVRALDEISLRNALFSKGGNGRDGHRWGTVIPVGAIGIIEGDSHLGGKHKVVSFEDQGGGFVTDIVHESKFVRV